MVSFQEAYDKIPGASPGDGVLVEKFLKGGLDNDIEMIDCLTALYHAIRASEAYLPERSVIMEIPENALDEWFPAETCSRAGTMNHSTDIDVIASDPYDNKLKMTKSDKNMILNAVSNVKQKGGGPLQTVGTTAGWSGISVLNPGVGSFVASTLETGAGAAIQIGTSIEGAMEFASKSKDFFSGDNISRFGILCGVAASALMPAILISASLQANVDPRPVTQQVLSRAFNQSKISEYQTTLEAGGDVSKFNFNGEHIPSKPSDQFLALISPYEASGGFFSGHEETFMNKQYLQKFDEFGRHIVAVMNDATNIPESSFLDVAKAFSVTLDKHATLKDCAGTQVCLSTMALMKDVLTSDSSGKFYAGGKVLGVPKEGEDREKVAGENMAKLLSAMRQRAPSVTSYFNPLVYDADLNHIYQFSAHVAGNDDKNNPDNVLSDFIGKPAGADEKYHFKKAPTRQWTSIDAWRYILTSSNTMDGTCLGFLAMSLIMNRVLSKIRDNDESPTWRALGVMSLKEVTRLPILSTILSGKGTGWSGLVKYHTMVGTLMYSLGCSEYLRSARIITSFTEAMETTASFFGTSLLSVASRMFLPNSTHRDMGIGNYDAYISILYVALAVSNIAYVWDIYARRRGSRGGDMGSGPPLFVVTASIIFSLPRFL